ncbi:VOC family protein [Halobacillus litoralis]|uniref:VOC family protein n=1 Tax=Halobacillus litoralis TaxID=45668 RepID=UPI001CFD8C3B|nr:VOC family protein [Halobacillus litoralis]
MKDVLSSHFRNSKEPEGKESPVLNQIGTVFVPVRHIERARDWYCDLLGLPNDREILFGHLYVLPMKGTGMVLDSKIYEEGKEYQTPVFHLDTKDINAAYEFMRHKGVELVTDIRHDHYFNIKDPDGNLLMICQC